MKAIKAAMFGIAMLSFTGIASAETLEVKIPFAFIVGSQQMPAGAYRIQRSSETGAPILLIQGEKGTTAQMFIQTTPLDRVTNPVGEPALIFVPDETANRLTAIWGSSGAGYEVSARRGHAKVASQIVIRALARS